MEPDRAVRLPDQDTEPAPGSGPAPVQTLIDQFLQQQAATTAAERFAQRHDGETAHVHRDRYRDLMPATPPAEGQQYAFDVDLDACSGCKACVTACHELNGLDEGEAWRSVGVLVGTGALPVVQPVTTACHHCADPGCLNGCPVDAYEKDPVTGIVSHLDDQCIGCRYCTLTCPYEVPQYSADLGIVRKCDLCADRLSAGEAPACVQACPTEAISIRVVDVERYADDIPEPWPFEAPDAAITRPTTGYRSTRDLGTGVEPADLHAVTPGRAHIPLTVMLVLTQMAVGAYAALWALRVTGMLHPVAGAPGKAAAVGLAAVALGASVLHLGRPHLAWKAVIGLGHSWLSREIVAFSAFALLAASAAAPGPLPSGAWPEAGAVLLGAVAVWCSAMVYAVTGRPFWRIGRVVVRFALTAAGPGNAAAAVTLAGTALAGGAGGALAGVPPVAWTGSVAMLAGLGVDLAVLRHRRRGEGDGLARTARLLAGELHPAVLRRAALGLAAAGMLAAAAVSAATGAAPAALALAVGGLACGTTGDLLERWWFFTAEASVRMPGGRP